jgi:DNA polymerase-3 subunit epsilon
MPNFFTRTIDRLVISDPSFRFLFHRQDTDEAISIDCETTGFDPWVDDIVSVAAIPIVGKRILTSEAYRAVIRPNADLRAESIKVHQLRRQDVEHGREMADVLPELLRFIGNRPLVGYWIDFDVRMLNKHVLKMLNVRLPNDQIDVCTLYHERKYGNAPPGTQIDLRYAAIMDDLKLPPLVGHDPFNDALGAAEMFVILREMKARGERIKRIRDADDVVDVMTG